MRWLTLSLVCVSLAGGNAYGQQQREFVALVDFAEEHADGANLLSRLDRSVIIQYPGRRGRTDATVANATEAMSPGQATEVLVRYGSLAQVFVDANNTIARVVARDLGGVNPERAKAAVVLALQQAGGAALFVTDRRTPTEKAAREWANIDGQEALMTRWGQLAERPGVRFLAFKGIVMCRVGMENPANFQQELLARENVRDEFSRSIKAPADAAGNTELVKRYVGEMDALFRDLESGGAMNDRMSVYETAWLGQLRPALLSTDPPPVLLASTGAFNANLSQAASPNGCTVYVFGSKGGKASVEYGTPADADQGNWSDAGQQTMATLELNQGLYRFRLLRNKTETGATGKVDCNRPSRGVEVPEP